MRVASLLLLLSACAANAVGDVRRPYTAKLDPERTPLPFVAAADVDGVLIWANTTLWRDAPSDTESWVSVVGIDLQNTSDVPVEFRLSDLRLVDDKGRHTAPFFAPSLMQVPITIGALENGVHAFPPNTDDTESLMVGAQTSVFLKAQRRNGPSAGRWLDGQGVGYVPRDWSDQVRFVRAPDEFTHRAIFDRKLAPGEKAHGYLIFPRIATDSTRVDLIWMPRGSEEVARIPFVVKRG